MKNQGFTLVELLIAVALAGIVLAIGVGAINGNFIHSFRESCASQGGKWTEGIQYGRHTAFCTYD